MVGTSPTMAASSPAELEADLAEVSTGKPSLESLDYPMDRPGIRAFPSPSANRIIKEMLRISVPHMFGTSKTEGPSIKV